MAAAARLCEKKHINNSGLDKDICIKFYGIVHLKLAYTTACTTGLYDSTRCSHSLNGSKLQ